MTYLLLILLQVATGAYDIHMAKVPSMTECYTLMTQLEKTIPPAPGISYSLSCITMRSTTEAPV